MPQAQRKSKAQNGQSSRGDRLKSISTYLEKSTGRMNAALPKHLTPERLIRVAITAISRNPRLLECTKESLVLALLEAGQLGLEPNGVMGQAYLVPYKNKKLGRYEAQFQPGYRGLMDLARRSGDVSKVETRPVYKGDQFSYEYGLEPKLVHRPIDPSEAGELTHVYAIAWFSNGAEPVFEVMDRGQVEAIRRRSKASDSGPWVTDYEPMARKTVFKRLSKSLPLSPEAEAAIEVDNRFEGGEAVSLAALSTDFQQGGRPALPAPEPRETRTEQAGREVSVAADNEPSAEDLQERVKAKRAYFGTLHEVAGDVPTEPRHRWQREVVGTESTKGWDTSDFQRAAELLDEEIGIDLLRPAVDDQGEEQEELL